MKKFFGTALSAILCAALLSGCGGDGVGETVSEIAVASVETTTDSETSVTAETAAVTETVPETSEISETAETVTVTEITETEKVPEMPQFEKIDMSGYTGNFYEWEYDYSIVAYDRESFAGGGDIIGAAEELLADYDGLLFEEGVWEDFDGDGAKEGFVCFSAVFSGGFTGIERYVVFVDAEGNAELIPRADGEIYDEGITLYPMRYNGFWHMCTAFGVNNITHHSEIYAVENGKPVHKKTSFSPVDPFCGAFTLESAAQAHGSWISFWNEEEKSYFILADEDLTEEEINELFNSAAFKENEYLTELYENAEQLENFCGVTGKKYYSVGGMWTEGFVRTSGGFEKYEYAIICPYYKNGVYATGVDISKAEAEMVRLEK